MEEKYYTTDELATYLGVTVSDVYKLREYKKIGGEKRGGNRVYFSQTDVDRYKASLLDPIQEAGEIEEVPLALPATVKKMPLCHRCKRRFLREEEYELEELTDGDGEQIWKAACRGGCHIDYQSKYTNLVEELISLRAVLDHIIAAHT